MGALIVQLGENLQLILNAVFVGNGNEIRTEIFHVTILQAPDSQGILIS